MGSSNLIIHSYYSSYGGSLHDHLSFQEKKKPSSFFQSVETLITLPSNDFLKYLKIKQTFTPDEPLFFTFGNSGLIKFWSGTTGRCLLIQEDKTYEKIANNSSYSKDIEHQQVFLNAYFNETTRMFYTNTIDHNIVAFNIKKLKLEKQVKENFVFSNFIFIYFKFIGQLGDVLDVRFLNGNDHNPLYIIIASNDEKVKVFHLNTWDCQMLKGHTDIVIGLDISYDHSLIGTCSKVC
jgi:U3 small nucleolar RNA-associated protein 13